MLYQSLFHRKHGHFDTVHAGVCIGKNAQEQVMIAHANLVPKIANDYFNEPLQTMLDREGGDRSFIVYRPKNTNFADMVGQVAASEKTRLTWSITSAMTSVLPVVNLNLTNESSPRTISTMTFCSCFAIEVMKMAAVKIGVKPVDLSSRSTPKSLESFLETNADFEKLCYLGQNAYQRIENEVLLQLARLHQQKNEAAQRKYVSAYNAFKKAKAFIYTQALTEESDQINVLLQHVLPEFEKNTGWYPTPKSYTAVSTLARKMGIFKKDITTQNQEIKKEVYKSSFRMGC